MEGWSRGAGLRGSGGGGRGGLGVEKKKGTASCEWSQRKITSRRRPPTQKFIAYVHFRRSLGSSRVCE